MAIPPPPRRSLLLAGMAGAIMLAAGCSTMHVQTQTPPLQADAGWALLPIINYTQTPQAGLRAEAILESLVRTRGRHNLRRYPARMNSESLFEPAERDVLERTVGWARSAGLRYGLTGSVDEWRYKVGVDGEPAVGVTLQLLDLADGSVLWSATGSKTGWSREALSAVAQKLLEELSRPLAAPTTPAR
ncbi:MAG: penicillin-binding protein activator LpoB [Burkholderiaceae bacterium]